MDVIDEVTVRQSKPGEEKYLLEFAKTQSWDYSMYDYRSYVRFDPTYLLVAVDKTGTPIGFGGLSLITPKLYYLSSFIVREDHRNKGIGRKLWKAMLEKAGDSNIAIDGVIAMVDWYKKNGFQFQSFKVCCHNILITDEMKQPHVYKYDIQTLSEDRWPALMNYDRKVYPTFDRENILRVWFSDEYVEVVLGMKEETIVGYGSIHKQSDNVYALRNVYADSEEVLEEMLRKMFDKLPTGTTSRFVLVDGKPMPRYLKTADTSTDSSQRLFNKEMIETNNERMWLGTANII